MAYIDTKVDLPPCPHCGALDFVYRNIRVYGWVKEYFDLSGEVDVLDLDDMQATNHLTFRCCACRKVRQDVVLVGRKLKVRNS